jgi:hypothetical protein
MRGIKILSTLVAVIFIVSTAIAAPITVNRFALLGEEIAARSGNAESVKAAFNEKLNSETIQKLFKDGKVNEAYAELQREFSVLPSEEQKRAAIIAALNGVVALQKSNVPVDQLTTTQIDEIANAEYIQGGDWTAAMNYGLGARASGQNMFGPGHQEILAARSEATLDKEIVINGITVRLNSELYSKDNPAILEKFVGSLDNTKYTQVSFYPNLADGATIDGTHLILPQDFLTNTAEVKSAEMGIVKTRYATKLDVFKQYYAGMNDVDLAATILDYYLGHEVLEKTVRDSNGGMELDIVDHYKQVVVEHEKQIGKTGLWLDLYKAVGAEVNADVLNNNEGNAKIMEGIYGAINDKIAENKVSVVVAQEALEQNDFLRGTLVGLQLQKVNVIILPSNISKENLEAATKDAKSFVFIDVEGSKTIDIFKKTATEFMQDKSGLFATLSKALFTEAKDYDPLDFLVNFTKVLDFYINESINYANAGQKGATDVNTTVDWFKTFIGSVSKIVLEMGEIQKTVMRQRTMSIAA